MKPESIIRPLLALLLGASTLLAASCASPAPKSAQAKDYDEVYDTGSNLPRRVPKHHADDASTATGVETVGAEALAGTSDHAIIKNPPGVGK
jgi:ABC-type oligopeptide transport system substrate-binding subunit